MILVADKAERRRTLLAAIARKEQNLNRWFEHSTSTILHHDDSCCEESRLWFLAYARSMEINTLSQFRIKTPVWLTDLFEWGPSPWPIAWCEVIKRETIDCGVFAALAREVFTAQGVQAHPALALISYNEACTRHWKDMWHSLKKRDEKAFPWVGDEIVYHEICVIETMESQARFFDPTWGFWYESHPRSGQAALLALKTECPRLLKWDNRTIAHGEWFSI